jgi:uncharacterized caspase-like protein
MAGMVVMGPAPDAKRQALVIGNQAYKPDVGLLHNPRKDAALVAAALRTAGFNAPVVTDLGRIALLREVNAYAARLQAAGGEAMGFLYYSGHGAANPADGRNYLVPVDVATAASADLWEESVPVDEVLRRLTDAAPNADQVVVVDACRNQLGLPLKGPKGLTREPERGGVFLAYSTGLGAPADDGNPNDPAGPYARVLASELGKGKRPIAIFFDDVKYAVIDSTHHAQVPWSTDGLARRMLIGLESAAPPPRPSSGLNARVQAAVDAALQAERQGREKAAEALLVVAQADQAAAMARDAAAKADAGEAGYGALTGTGTVEGKAVSCRYRGQVSNGESNGYGVRMWSTGERDEGQFIDNRMSGLITLMHGDGVVYKGQVQQDLYVGLGEFTTNEETRRGEWKNGHSSGFSKSNYISGNTFIGQSANDIKDGFGVFIFRSGERLEGSWANDEFTGFGVRRDAQGRVIEQGEFVANQLKTPMTP